MSFQQSLVDALLLSVSATANHQEGTAPAAARYGRYSGDAKSASDKPERDHALKGNLTKRGGSTAAASSRSSTASSSSSPSSRSGGGRPVLKARHVVDLSFLASRSYSSTALRSSSPPTPEMKYRRFQRNAAPGGGGGDGGDSIKETTRGRTSTMRRSRHQRNEEAAKCRIDPPRAQTDDDHADSSSSTYSNGSSTSTAATAELSTSDDSAADDARRPPPSSNDRRRRRSRRTKVRFALDANDNVLEEAVECTYVGPLTDEERASCYLTRRETKTNKRAAFLLAREHALRHVDHVQLLQDLFASPIKCAGDVGGGGGDDRGTPTFDSDRRPGSADEVLRWVQREAVSGGATTMPEDDEEEDDSDGMTTTTTADVLLRRIGNSEARGLEPFVAPLLRRHQKWAIRTVLERHRHLRRLMRRDNDNDHGYHDNDEALRRCCDNVNACTRDLARLLAEADAMAARHIYREQQ